MTEKNEATIILAWPEKRRIVAAYNAILPESLKSIKGSSVDLSLVDGSLFIHFRAETVTALRASVNSYLRWLSMVEGTLDVIKERMDRKPLT